MNNPIEKHALLIIDMQNDFVIPGAPQHVAGALDSIPFIRQALDFFRLKQWPVFHVNREHRADGSDIEIIREQKFNKQRKFTVPGTRGCEIVHELTPVPGEYRIVKTRYSAFMKTELDFMLRRLDIRQIVICGTQYPVCIRATIYDAISYGYDVTLLTDATSAQTPEIAAANIRDIENLGVTCVTTDRFVNGEVKDGE
jgi:nicotinamidase-related amidase